MLRQECQRLRSAQQVRVQAQHGAVARCHACLTVRLPYIRSEGHICAAFKYQVRFYVTIPPQDEYGVVRTPDKVVCQTSSGRSKKHQQLASADVTLQLWLCVHTSMLKTLPVRQGRPPHFPLALSAEPPSRGCGAGALGFAEPTAFLSSAGMLQARLQPSCFRRGATAPSNPPGTRITYTGVCMRMTALCGLAHSCRRMRGCSHRHQCLVSVCLAAATALPEPDADTRAAQTGTPLQVHARAGPPPEPLLQLRPASAPQQAPDQAYGRAPPAHGRGSPPLGRPSPALHT